LPQAAGWHYEEHGGGNQGPPLVFIHGAGGSRLHWPPALRRLAARHTLAVDLPGHGQSPTEDETSIDGYAGRLGAWREVAAVPRPVLVGHSMGSAVALASALRAPSTLAGLVLLGAGARLRINPTLLENAGRPESFAAIVEQILQWSFAPQAEPRLVELARARMIETGPTILARDLRACQAFDVSARLAEIRLPTLIIVGTSDRMTPPRLSEELQAGIAGACLERVEGAGHMVMLEQPEDVARFLVGFLEKTPILDDSHVHAKGGER